MLLSKHLTTNITTWAYGRKSENEGGSAKIIGWGGGGGAGGGGVDVLRGVGCGGGINKPGRPLRPTQPQHSTRRPAPPGALLSSPRGAPPTATKCAGVFSRS